MTQLTRSNSWERPITATSSSGLRTSGSGFRFKQTCWAAADSGSGIKGSAAQRWVSIAPEPPASETCPAWSPRSESLRPALVQPCGCRRPIPRKPWIVPVWLGVSARRPVAKSRRLSAMPMIRAQPSFLLSARSTTTIPQLTSRAAHVEATVTDGRRFSHDPSAGALNKPDFRSSA